MWSKAKALLAIAAFALTPVDAIWPVPKKISTGDKVLFIDQSLDITYNGDFVCWKPPGSVFYSCNHSAQLDTETLLEKQMPYTYKFQPDAGSKFNSKQIVQAGVSRALQAIFNDNFVPWKLRERNSDFEPDLQKKQWVKSLKIVQTEEDDKSTFKPLAGEVDESYSLTLSEKGEASIKAKSSTGILHGLETFLQLFFKHSSGTSWYTPHAPVTIQDAPEYPHRGILLDVARSFFEVEHIKRTIDAMSWSKLNRLHLHITDSQSWPLEIPALPKLAEKGAYRKGLTYSPEDLAGIYEYGLAYKDLIVAYNEKPYQWWCKEPPCGAFRMNSTDVYDFLDTLFEDLFPRISPYSAYFHAGGDELNHNDSMLDPGVRSNKTEVLAPLLQKFVDYTHGKIRDAGLTPFVWEEMITEWNMTLGKDVVIQSWLGNGAVKAMAEAGHKVIDSDYNFWVSNDSVFWKTTSIVVVDNGSTLITATLSRPTTPSTTGAVPTKSWRLIYSHDPRAGLSEEAAKLVLGGEAAVWTETIDSVNLDTIVWPRAAVMGEVLWSGRTDASGQNRSQYDAAPRLAELRERMVARGVSASPIQMPFCTQGNATECAQFDG
ncbi:Beta-hexosaminidase [Fusarium oxysporum f. sp. vasinfectum]|nr:Beta-hexosaminidase [Fusarium oxysporum f. sp. vasinfectum]